jgi:hypothetical protein
LLGMTSARSEEAALSILGRGGLAAVDDLESFGQIEPLGVRQVVAVKVCVPMRGSDRLESRLNPNFGEGQLASALAHYEADQASAKQ